LTTTTEHSTISGQSTTYEPATTTTVHNCLGIDMKNVTNTDYSILVYVYVENIKEFSEIFNYDYSRFFNNTGVKVDNNSEITTIEMEFYAIQLSRLIFISSADITDYLKIELDDFYPVDVT
jgi:hypothetical protein